MDLVGFGNLMEIGGRALLESLRDISQRKLGVNSALSIAVRAALDAGDDTKMDAVQKALAQLPDDVRDDVLSQAHRQMCLSDIGLLGAWPTPGSSGGTPPTKH